MVLRILRWHQYEAEHVVTLGDRCPLGIDEQNAKELDFPNTIEGWKLHSQNVMLSLASQSFVINEYTNHQYLDVQNDKNSRMDNYTYMSHTMKYKNKTYTFEPF